jgi:hypothetical protein
MFFFSLVEVTFAHGVVRGTVEKSFICVCEIMSFQVNPLFTVIVALMLFQLLLKLNSSRAGRGLILVLFLQ